MAITSPKLKSLVLAELCNYQASSLLDGTGGVAGGVSCSLIALLHLQFNWVRIPNERAGKKEKKTAGHESSAMFQNFHHHRQEMIRENPSFRQNLGYFILISYSVGEGSKWSSILRFRCRCLATDAGQCLANQGRQPWGPPPPTTTTTTTATTTNGNIKAASLKSSHSEWISILIYCAHYLAINCSWIVSSVQDRRANQLALQRFKQGAQIARSS